MKIPRVALALLFAAAPLAAQAPAPPAGVTEREIVVPGPVPLPGTLTLPAGKGPFPALIIVHGSGAGDRNMTLGPNAPYRDLAWGLAAQGVAVLRYDKRAKVRPAWYAARVFTVKDETVDDAVSALALLRAQPEVDAKRTAFIGHSLGGMLAPRIALADGKVAGAVIMAGATRLGLGEQMERQFAYLVQAAGPDSAAVRTALAPYQPGLARIKALQPGDSGDTTPIIGAPAAYYLDLRGYDPAVAIREVKVPLLVLQGMRDYQVTPEQLDDWLRVLGPRPDLTVIRYPGLNHLFLQGEGTPRPTEYGIPGAVDPKVIDDIAGWMKRR